MDYPEIYEHIGSQLAPTIQEIMNRKDNDNNTLIGMIAIMKLI